MAKNVVNRIDRNLARRLRDARQEAGLSTRAVAEKLPKRLAVSKTTITSYENGTSVPDVDTLGALANLYHRTINWFLENRTGLSDFRYRNLKPRVRLHDKRHFEASAGKWVEAYLNLEKHLNATLRKELGAPNNGTEPKELAASVRARLNLNDSLPIQSVVRLMESCAVRVLELRTPLQADGFAARHEDDPILILNPNTSNERLRMNVALELAYALYEPERQQLGWSDTVLEKKAYEFACELLLPQSQLELAFQGKSFLRLIEFKERFGISLAAMIHRSEQTGIVKTTTARWLWSEMLHRGWRANEPGFVWRDRAIRFEMLMESALHTGALTWTKAEEITGIREEELQKRIADLYSGIPSKAESTDDRKLKLLRFPGEEQ